MSATLFLAPLVLASWIAPAAVVGDAGLQVAQEPPLTRQEALWRMRAEKAGQLRPYEQGRLERLLVKFETEDLLGRLLDPPRGLHPKVGHITPGSSLSFGVGYREPRLFGRKAELSLSTLGSFREYWRMDGRLRLSDLAGKDAFVEFYGGGPSGRRRRSTA